MLIKKENGLDLTGANLTFAEVVAALGYVPENVANKSTDVNLGTSNTLYPTQNAAKSYTDGAAFINAIIFG